MALGNIPVGTPKQLSATALIKQPFTPSFGSAAQNAGGCVIGVFCSSSSSGTLALYDSATAQTSTGKIVDTFNLTAGTWYSLPIAFVNGLYAVVGGTASITVVYL